MEIRVNGETREIDACATVAALVSALGLEQYKGVAVEMNGTFVRREAYAETDVPPNATVEIVRFVGGG